MAKDLARIISSASARSQSRSSLRDPELERKLREINQRLPLNKRVLSGALRGAATVGNVLDTPGGILRTSISALAGDTDPGDILRSVYDVDARVSGSELVGQRGDDFTWQGLGAEILFDPLNLVTLGTKTAVGKSLQAISKTTTRRAALQRVADATTDVARKAKYLEEIKELDKRIPALQKIVDEAPKGAESRAVLQFDPVGKILFGMKEPVPLIQSPRLNKAIAAPFKITGKVPGVAPTGRYIKSKFSTSLGDPVVDEIRNILKAEQRGMAENVNVVGQRISKDWNAITKNLIDEGAIKDISEAKEMFTVARELDGLADNIQGELSKTLDKFGISAKNSKKAFAQLKKKTARKFQRLQNLKNLANELQTTTGPVTERMVLDRAGVKSSKELADQISTLSSETKELKGAVKNIQLQESALTRLSGVPDVIKEFARTFHGQVDSSFQKAVQLSVPFAPRKEAIGYLHRFATPEALELLNDEGLVKLINDKFAQRWKTVRNATVNREGVQKARTLRDTLLADVNKFVREATGRNIEYFTTDPVKIYGHYIRTIHRAQTRTKLVSLWSQMRAMPIKKGKKLINTQKTIPLHRWIKPGKSTPPKILKWGDASWEYRSTQKEIKEALQKAGYKDIGVPTEHLDEFNKLHDAILGKFEKVDSLIQIYDRVLNFYRGLLTAPFPAFGVRNLFTVVTMNWMAGGVSFKHYKQALRIMNKGIDETKKLMNTGMLDEAAPIGQVRGTSIFDGGAEVAADGSINFGRNIGKAFDGRELDEVIGSAEEFSKISNNHATMQSILNMLRRANSLDERGEKVLRAIYAQSDLKFMESLVETSTNYSLRGFTGETQFMSTLSGYKFFKFRFLKDLLKGHSLGAEVGVVLHESAHAAYWMSSQETKNQVIKLFNDLSESGKLQQFTSHMTGHTSAEALQYYSQNPSEFFAIANKKPKSKKNPNRRAVGSQSAFPYSQNIANILAVVFPIIEKNMT